MSDANGHPHPDSDGDRRRRRPRRDELDAVLRAMREEQLGGVSPDLSRSVMAKLGFQRATAAAARRERIGRWVRRGSTAALLLAVCGGVLGWVHVHRIERSRATSVEEVVRASLEHQGRLLGHVADGIRALEQLRSDDQVRDLPPASTERPTGGPLPRGGLSLPLDDGDRPAEAPHKKA